MPYLQPLSALDTLRDRLRTELDVHHAVHAIEWGNPRAMSEALKRLRHDLGDSGNDKPAADQLQAALVRFAKTADVSSFTELKYVCYGSTVPVGRDGWRLIDRQSLFSSLLEQVNQRAQQPKQFRRCYQGLLSGYFGFERNLDKPGDADNRWVFLRTYLADRLDVLRDASLQRAQMPDWLNVLSEHRNLLTEDPCSRYADALVREDQSELQRVCTGLGISSNSWVWEEALMAYVVRVCESEDAAFRKCMKAVLELVNGNTPMRLPSALATRATAMVVTRYAKCVDHPEHPVLRDTCVELIGNPWLKRTSWDALVNHEPARLMVNSWLKQRLIRDFFELLAADGAADLRRLEYWLKWEPQITDMWFVMGTEAMANTSDEFKELRKRMAGRDRRLVDNNHLNNAFVMRIGPLLVIEFGVTGNACYVFAASDFRANLEQKVFRLAELKQRVGVAARLSHMSSWEYRFDVDIGRLLRRTPEHQGHLSYTHEIDNVRQHQRQAAHPARTTPAETLSAETTLSAPAVRLSEVNWFQRTQPTQQEPEQRVDPPQAGRLNDLDANFVKSLCDQHGLEWEDNRPKNGSFWVLLPSRGRNLAVGELLQRLGFQYNAGRGYWIK